MKLYMFRTVRLSIIRSLFTVHSAMLCVIQVCRQLSSRARMEVHGSSIPFLLESCLQTCMTYTTAECTPDDGQTNCPKHVDFHPKINLWN